MIKLKSIFLADGNDAERNIGFVKKIIPFLTLSFFLPHYIASRLLMTAGLLMLALGGVRPLVFKGKGTVAGYVFLGVAFTVALIYWNTLGAFRTAAFAALLAVAAVSRQIADKKYYERLLNVMILGGSLASVHAVIEYLLNRSDPLYRCQGFYTNPNFLGTALTFVVVICAYKVSCHEKRPWLYYGAAVLCAVGIYLCKSMSLWLVAFIAVLIMLILHREYKLLTVFLSFVGLAVLAIIFVPGLLSRVNELPATVENRMKIWSFALSNIPDAPLFGRGFYSYKFLFEQLPADTAVYKASMSHSVYLDSILCHGAVGTALALNSVVRYFTALFSARKKQKANSGSTRISSLVIALTAALLLYGLIDTTFVWIGTGSIVIMLASGIGIEENI